MNFKGISVKDERLKKCEPIKGAAYNGIYTGSPGRDIYYMLSYLNDNQIKEIANELEKQFPIIPPGNHVNVGACIRFIYGQFGKQGVLRSEKDYERMKKENLNWDKSIYFLKILYDKMEENKNFYGMSILCEMNAHRFGDQAVLNRDKYKLIDMEILYKRSVEYAHKCKSYKQLFTPYYWAYKYFSKFKNKKKAIFYVYLTITSAEKYCPDARPGYVDKLTDCMKYIEKYDNVKWNKFYKDYRKNAKNKYIKKVLKKIK